MLNGIPMHCDVARRRIKYILSLEFIKIILKLKQHFRY